MPSLSPPRWRLLAGFAILPPLDALAGFLLFPLVWRLGDHGGGRLGDPNHAAAIFAVLAGISGVVVTVAGAVPVVFWLLRTGRVSWPQVLLAGLVLGNAPFAAYLIALIMPATLVRLIEGTLTEHLLPFSELMWAGARATLLGSAFGAMSAAVFWLVAICGTELNRESS